MTAKHEKALTLSKYYRLTPLKNAALQAGMPALQSIPLLCFDIETLRLDATYLSAVSFGK